MSANFTPDKNTITPLEPFRFWCQKVLPLVYDDSLSYYELLCKVVDYLNKAMEDVDLLSEDVTNLFDSYKDLQDYVNDHVTELENFVNNYFNNLNVQTEINNKLDAMVEDGTLSNIVYAAFHAEVLEDVQHIVSTWIANNLVQEAGYVLDSSLTVEDAAADAKAAGDAIRLADAKSDSIISNVTIPVPIKINEQFKVRSTINSSNVWTNVSISSPSRAIITKVPDNCVSITMDVKANSVIAFLNTPANTARDTPDFATSYPGRIVYADTETHTFLRESDMNYIYFLVTTTADINVQPTIIYNISGVRINSADIAANKMALDHIEKITGYSKDITEEFEFFDGYRVSYIDGSLTSSSARSATNYIDVTDYDRIIITRVLTASSLAEGIAFYDDDYTFISGTQDYHNTQLETSETFVMEVGIPAGATYIRSTWWNVEHEDFFDFKCVGVVDYKSDLPDYYFENSYIGNRIATILNNRKAMAMAGDEMFFFTDPHIYRKSLNNIENGMNTEKLIRFIGTITNIKMAVCGGDLLNGAAMTPAECLGLFTAVKEHYSKIWDNLYMIIGNHEYNNPSDDPAQVVNELTTTEIYNELVKYHENEFGGVDSYGDYWLDNKVQKIRYFFLGCNSVGNLNNNQIKWIAKEFESIPAGYTVLLFSHIGLTQSAQPLNKFSDIIDMLDHAKAASNYTFDGVTYTYSGLDIEIAGVLSGHIHRDLNMTSTGGIPIIATMCDRGPTASTSVEYDHARPYGSVLEQALEVVQLDTTNKKLYLTRIGGSFDGENELVNPDRTFSY